MCIKRGGMSTRLAIPNVSSLCARSQRRSRSLKRRKEPVMTRNYRKGWVGVVSVLMFFIGGTSFANGDFKVECPEAIQVDERLASIHTLWEGAADNGLDDFEECRPALAVLVLPVDTQWPSSFGQWSIPTFGQFSFRVAAQSNDSAFAVST